MGTHRHETGRSARGHAHGAVHVVYRDATGNQRGSEHQVIDVGSNTVGALGIGEIGQK
jgi:hypothetical protein